MDEATTPSPVSLHDPDAFHAACDRLLREARGHLVRILAPRLDLPLLDRETVIDALQQRIRRSRHTRIRVLFEDAAPAVRHGHRLVELSRRWPSFVTLRQLPPDVREDAAWLLVEPHDLLWRPDHMQLTDGVLAWNDRRRAPQLRRRFDEWWPHGQPDPALRRLHI